MCSFAKKIRRIESLRNFLIVGLITYMYPTMSYLVTALFDRSKKHANKYDSKLINRLNRLITIIPCSDTYFIRKAVLEGLRKPR